MRLDLPATMPGIAGKVLGQKLFMKPDQMLDLDEVRRCWKKSRYQVYKAANTVIRDERGEPLLDERGLPQPILRTIARTGHQRYYLRSEVERVFGDAVIDPDPNRDVRRLYRAGSEFGTRAA